MGKKGNQNSISVFKSCVSFFSRWREKRKKCSSFCVDKSEHKLVFPLKHSPPPLTLALTQHFSSLGFDSLQLRPKKKNFYELRNEAMKLKRQTNLCNHLTMTKMTISRRSNGGEKFNVKFPDDLKVSASFPSRYIECSSEHRSCERESLPSDGPLLQPNWVLIPLLSFADLWVIKRKKGQTMANYLQCLGTLSGNERMVMHLIIDSHLCLGHNADLLATCSSPHSLSVCMFCADRLVTRCLKLCKCLPTSRRTSRPFPELYCFTCIVTSYCVNRLRHRHGKVWVLRFCTNTRLDPTKLMITRQNMDF